VIKGVNNDTNNKINMPIENIQFKRSGFCVTEWGVILK
jgi:arginine deiminase